MIARSIALSLLAALSIGCGGAVHRARRPGTLAARAPSTLARPGCDPAGAGGPRLCALASVDADTGVIEVTLRIDPDALPADRREVRLAFGSSALGARYLEERVTVLDRPSWPASLGSVPEPVTLRYRVLLDASAGPRPGTSWRRPEGWHLIGASFLPDLIVDDRPAHAPATLELDTGREPLSTAAGDDRRVFDAASLRRLAAETYEVGPLASARREVGSTTLFVATSDRESDALDPIADVLARALGSLERRMGPPPTDSVLVVFHPVGAPAFEERLGSSIVSADASGLPPDPLYGASSTLVQLAHLWMPGTHASAEPWLAEGVTDYLAILTMAELAGAPPLSVATLVLRRHRAHDGAAPRAPRDLGLAAGFCLDAELRERGSSLGAALRTTLARDEDEPLGAEALLEDLAAVSPESASYLAALLESEGGFAIDECIERAGFVAREVSYQGLGDRALAFDVLGVEALRPLEDAQGFVVDVANEGSQLAPGDVVLEVAGAAVADLGDVAWALRDASEGDRVRLTMRRRGEPRSIELTIPALGTEAREERVRVELTPVDAESP